MFPTTGGWRLVVFIRRTAAAAAGGPNLLLPQSACLSQHYSSTPDSEPCPTASYLVASCGLSPAAAAAASRRVRICSTAKADAVLALLRRYGFSDAHIARMLPVASRLLLLDPDKIVRPKLEFFASIGFTAAVLAGTPILERSLEKHIIPCVEFLRGFLGTDANIRTAVSRNPYALRPDLERTMRPASEALRRHGLSKEAIWKLLVLQVGVLSMPPDRIAGIVEDLESLVLPVTDSRFVNGFHVMCRLKRDTVWRRFALYQSFGLSKSQVAMAFLTQPSIMGLKDETIQRKLLFFRDELKIALSLVIARLKTLALSVEKNILPKCAVLSVLTREGKIRGDIDLLVPLGTSTKQFSESYVKKYEKVVPDVVRAYQGKIKFKGFLDEDKGY